MEEECDDGRNTFGGLAKNGHNVSCLQVKPCASTASNEESRPTLVIASKENGCGIGCLQVKPCASNNKEYVDNKDDDDYVNKYYVLMLS